MTDSEVVDRAVVRTHESHRLVAISEKLAADARRIAISTRAEVQAVIKANEEILRRASRLVAVDAASAAIPELDELKKRADKAIANTRVLREEYVAMRAVWIRIHRIEPHLPGRGRADTFLPG